MCQPNNKFFESFERLYAIVGSTLLIQVGFPSDVILTFGRQGRSIRIKRGLHQRPSLRRHEPVVIGRRSPDGLRGVVDDDVQALIDGLEVGEKAQ
jgi:hypothetical protein